MKADKRKRHLDAIEAAAYLSENYVKVSPRSLARFDIPYVVVLKRRLYSEGDLKKWAERKFAQAPRKIAATA